MPRYTIQTDAFCVEDIDASSLDEAIEEAFGDEGMGIRDLRSLERRFPRYVSDGGWCRVEQDDETVLEIGDCP